MYANVGQTEYEQEKEPIPVLIYRRAKVDDFLFAGGAVGPTIGDPIVRRNAEYVVSGRQPFKRPCCAYRCRDMKVSVNCRRVSASIYLESGGIPSPEEGRRVEFSIDQGTGG